MSSLETKSRYLQNKNLDKEIENSKIKFLGKSLSIDYVVCAECGFYGKDLSSHIPRLHKITNIEYKNKHQTSIKCDSVKNMMKDRISGVNNPGYQHNGKFSALSKNFIHYSEEKILETAKKISFSNKENGNNDSTLSYWLKQTNGNEELAKELLSNRQKTFSLEICIEKYGETEGQSIFDNRQQKWQETLNLKSDEEKLRINKAKIYKNGMISKSEKSLYNSLLMKFPNLKSQFIVSYNLTKNYVYDILLNNKIIEFNGDYWHANPNKYEKDQILKLPGRCNIAKDIWAKDAAKLDYAKQLGYDVLVIWESDFNKNKKETIDKCINFLIQ